MPSVQNKESQPFTYETLSWGQIFIVVTTLAVVTWYMLWRLDTINPDAPIFSWLIYTAEILGVITLLLHLFMTSRLMVREAPLPDHGQSVDVFIPTINESVDVVRRTAIKAMDMDYPHKTYILDDGRREDIRKLAQELGCYYLARNDNQDAKAGNLNFGLRHSNGEFIAIFDADHAPKQSFLMRTLGYFNDPQVAFVQTPQDFYNLDSYQHRAQLKKGRMWTEQGLFFRVIQRGKDFWNAAFFCGSCAIIRRSAVEAIGGFATGTVTEDIHTSIRLHKEGFISVYHAESLAFGIAPAHIDSFLKQRIRWGQGAMQVWRKEGILFSKDLTWAQKCNYLASMITYFDGWQKLLYYVTPAIVLITGWLPLLTSTQDFLLHFIPYFLMMMLCFDELGRGYNKIWVIEQYNMARFAAFCMATIGLFTGNLKFRVTNKKMAASSSEFWYLLPQYSIFILNAIAIPTSIMLFQNYQHLSLSPLLANLLWASVNMALAVTVLLFSLGRSHFNRHHYRFSIPLVTQLDTFNGREVFASAEDLSCAGALILAPRHLALKTGDMVTGKIYLPEGAVPFQAIVRSMRPSRETPAMRALGCEFLWNNAVARRRLEQFLYGSDLEWRIHNIAETSQTLLGWLSRKRVVMATDMSWEKTKASLLSSMVMGHSDTETITVNTGIISMDSDTNRSTAMVFRPLPEDQHFETALMTRDGWKWLRAKVSEHDTSVGSWPKMYLYQLETMPA